MKRIWFDMDDTLADYSGQLIKDFYERGVLVVQYQLYKPKSAKIKHLTNIIKETKGWYENLPVIDNTLNLLKEAVKKGYSVGILSKGPWYLEDAWAEKVRWCKKHIKPHYNNLDICLVNKDKSYVYGDILVEDFPEYADGWLKIWPNGKVLMRETEINSDYKHKRCIKFDDKTDINNLI